MMGDLWFEPHRLTEHTVWVSTPVQEAYQGMWDALVLLGEEQDESRHAAMADEARDAVRLFVRALLDAPGGRAP